MLSLSRSVSLSFSLARPEQPKAIHTQNTHAHKYLSLLAAGMLGHVSEVLQFPFTKNALGGPPPGSESEDESVEEAAIEDNAPKKRR